MRRIRGLLADTRPLAIPEFRRLFVGQAVTVVGAQLTVVAVPAQIYGMTGSSAYGLLTRLTDLRDPTGLSVLLPLLSPDVARH